jgi:group II intron reverse transcriptase/maturase
MRNADLILDIHRKRGAEGLPLERVYKHLFDPELYLRAYGKIYRNSGALTQGTTTETVDGMSVQKIHALIGLLQMERYEWTPVRREYIDKANGKLRPLGIPAWGDKLVQEVLRLLLEAYYEQKFSNLSHGFRPNRGCHTALRQIRKKWTGTVWFIEGDIKGCFDNIDHGILLQIIRRDIHDGRLLNLLKGLLEAGYMEAWQYYDTLSGTPQGGILRPLLANIYLNELDKFVEDTLIPAYTKGSIRRTNPAYGAVYQKLRNARDSADSIGIKSAKLELRKLMRRDPCDPNYRRLRYLRYADDFLLGFIGPKDGAETIRERIREHLEQQLKLNLSMEKTFITHANDEKAHFLGYEIKVTRQASLLTKGKRATNGNIALLMPWKVVQQYRNANSRDGKIQPRNDLLAEKDYTILQRYQGVLRGIYNYYCMATNVARRLGCIRQILEVSLTRTRARKHKCKVTEIYRKYRVTIMDCNALQVVITRQEKKPLVATFGGFPLERVPEGMGVVDFSPQKAWYKPGDNRSEVVQRLLAGKCELCGFEGPVQAHHIRKLSNIDRPGRRPKATWEKIMAARRRKTLMVCKDCHDAIHAGQYDGRSL